MDIGDFVTSWPDVTISGTYDDTERYLQARWNWDGNGGDMALATGGVLANIGATFTMGGAMEIGGSRCHMCGAERESESTEREWTRDEDGERSADSVTVVTYECGTIVKTTDGEAKRFVSLGDDCIQLG